MSFVISFLAGIGKRKAITIGKTHARRYAPALLQPLTPGFWFRHPFKAFYLWLLWKSLRFSWHVFTKYIRKMK